MLDGSTTVASEAYEGADLARAARFRVLVDRARHGRVDANTAGANEMAEVCDLSVLDVALRRLVHEADGLDRRDYSVQVRNVALQLLAHEADGLDRREYSVQVRNVLFARLRLDGDVVEVHPTEPARDAISERRVHHALEHRGRVDETKRHRSAPK